MTRNYFSEDTITAIGTPLTSDGGVGIVRLSGPKSLTIAKKFCKSFEKPRPRYLERILFVDSKTEEVLDDGLAVYFPEGQSFTGEEVVELQLHGGRFLLQTILSKLIDSGDCRLALPGEFSFRAVRNGKQSLSSATTVNQVVHAKSLFEVRAARNNLSKKRIEEFNQIAEKLKHLLAQTELSIDFVEQDVEVISKKDYQSVLTEILEKTDVLLKQMQLAKRLAQGVSVSIVGAPNAGKSTLFNALLTEDRAIVSKTAGTTRDVITETIQIGPYQVRLADTAGIRDGVEEIEAQGIGKAKTLKEESDLVIEVVDASLEEVNFTVGKGILVLNKWDLVRENRKSQILDRLKNSNNQVIPVSAASADGLEKLIQGILWELENSIKLEGDLFLPTEFQVQMLLRCQEHLRQGYEIVDKSGLEYPELLSSELKFSVKALTDLVGETTPDTILNKIFSEFCIGK